MFPHVGKQGKESCHLDGIRDSSLVFRTVTSDSSGDDFPSVGDVSLEHLIVLV